jgi:hypothetical protein
MECFLADITSYADSLRELAGSIQSGQSSGQAPASPQSGNASNRLSVDECHTAASTSAQTTVRQLVEWLERFKAERDAQQTLLAQVYTATCDHTTPCWASFRTLGSFLMLGDLDSMSLQAQKEKQVLEERVAHVEEQRNSGQQELIALHKQAAENKDVKESPVFETSYGFYSLMETL